MTTPFRQVILPGQIGSDVKAVKRAMQVIGVPGSGGLVLSNNAGVQFVTCVKTVEREHSLQVDGIYGEHVHAVIAPHFDAYGTMLYKTAKIRTPPQPPDVDQTAQQLAKKLLGYHAAGKYSADNPGDLRDIQHTADGVAVWSQCGHSLRIDHRVMAVLCMLIEDGFKIGTYAICSDHSCDGPHGHGGGLAVDISSINGTPVASNTPTSKKNTLAVDHFLHALTGAMTVRQLISGGYGNHRDTDCSNCTIPNADFYGATTMAEHCNHIHCGF